MATTLSYLYAEGDILCYEQAVTLLSVSPTGEEQGGYASYDVRQQVLRQNDDGSWLVEVATTPLEAQGALAVQLPLASEVTTVQLRVDPSGAVRTSPGAEVPSLAATFPLGAVEPGDAWTWVPPGASDDAAVTTIVHDFEELDGQLVARLVATSQVLTPSDDGDVSVRTEAVSCFSVDAGCVLSSTSVVDTALPDGTTVSVVVDLALVERTRFEAVIGTC